jgi:hypothetical protein
MKDAFLVYLDSRNTGIVVAIEPGEKGEICRREHLWKAGLKGRRKYPIVLGEFTFYEDALACVRGAVTTQRGWKIAFCGCPMPDRCD